MKTPIKCHFFAPAAGLKLSELLHHNRIIQSIIHPPEKGRGDSQKGGTAGLISPDDYLKQCFLGFEKTSKKKRPLRGRKKLPKKVFNKKRRPLRGRFSSKKRKILQNKRIIFEENTQNILKINVFGRR